jgi:hypothetical protein
MRAAPDAWVTVAQFNDPVDAQLLQVHLQVEGITAFLADAHLVQTDRLIAIAVGGVKVQVQGRDVGLAQDVIAALQAGAYALDEDFDPGPTLD